MLPSGIRAPGLKGPMRRIPGADVEVPRRRRDDRRSRSRIRSGSPARPAADRHRRVVAQRPGEAARETPFLRETRGLRSRGAEATASRRCRIPSALRHVTAPRAGARAATCLPPGGSSKAPCPAAARRGRGRRTDSARAKTLRASIRARRGTAATRCGFRARARRFATCRVRSSAATLLARWPRHPAPRRRHRLTPRRRLVPRRRLIPHRLHIPRRRGQAAAEPRLLLRFPPLHTAPSGAVFFETIPRAPR